MPVIVVGADTPQGRAVVEGLVEPGREVRAFVSDPIVGAELREMGVKVALGDVSDDSHIQGACTNCFTAVLIKRRRAISRERSFAAERTAGPGGLGCGGSRLRCHPGDLGPRRRATAGAGEGGANGFPRAP